MSRTLVTTVILLAILAGIAFLRASPVVDVARPASVVFVCRNGVAMSVWSAAYFNRLAEQHGLPERAAARAAIPSFREVPLRMRFALALDGYRLDGFEPQVIDAHDADEAELVVAIDTDLPADAAGTATATELWNGFPPMREQYFPSRRALKQRVEQLVERLSARPAS